MDYGLLNVGADAQCQWATPYNPSYLIIKNASDAAGQTFRDHNFRALQIRHETHHFIWAMLTKSGFVRPSHESAELETPFNLYRDELAAYIVNNRVAHGEL